MNTKLALVLALVFGFIAAIAVKSWITEESIKQKTEAEPLGILITSKRLTKGSVLKLENCTQGFIPKNFVTSGMIPFNERMRFADQVVNRDIDARAPIFEDFLDNANKTASLARLAVQPDRRAVTLQVDQVSGVAGLVRPGDYVDVIGTFTYEPSRKETPAATTRGQGNAANANNAASNTAGYVTKDITKTVYLLQAGRVLAIDNKVVSADVQAGSNARVTYRTVTLEVRPEDALRLISANHAGNLQLILRNPGEANLINGIEEVKVGPNTVRQKPTEYWDINEEVLNANDKNPVPGRR